MKKYCRLCKKKEERSQCGYGPKMWDKYSVNDANDDEIRKAAEDSGIVSGDGGEGGMGESHVSNFSDTVLEGNKSGDNSLRDWFSKSRSSDGKPGWVQLGGKYAGKPCAKQPGQTTKPKCGSSKMKRNLSKDEEEAAFRRKNKQDPNPNRKGKAINVNTEETQVNERDDLNQMQKDADANRDRAAKLKDRNLTRGSASLAAAKVADDVKKAARTGPQQHKGTRTGVKKLEEPKPTYTKTGVISKEETINERGDYWHPDPDKDRKLGGPGPNQRAREDRAASKSSSSSSSSAKPKLRPGESYMQYAKRMKTRLKKESVEIQEGEKDACYHKVKSRYSVWPSAYASGALVKCRKKGAKNWGNKTKKEEFSDWKSELFDEGTMPAKIDAKSHRSQQRAAKVRNLSKNGATEGERSAAKGKTKGPDLFGENCWPGYEKKGMKTMFGKRYPNCVKKTKTKKEEVEQLEEMPYQVMGSPDGKKEKKIGKPVKSRKYADARASELADTHKKTGGKYRSQYVEEIELTDAYGKTFAVIDDVIQNETKMEASKCPRCGQNPCVCTETYDIESMTEATRIPAKTGNIIQVFLSWRGRMYVIKMFFPSVAQPSRSEVQDQLDKVYPGSRVQSYKISEIKPGEQFLHTEETELEEGSAAWQRKEGKSESGGLNAKGVASYRAANPGSKLKTAVTTKPSKLKKGSKASNRRKSFCSRMKGMKAKLTSAKTARDPDSRINKSLRKWNC